MNIDREAIGEIARLIRNEAEAQLKFSSSRPMRSQDACDAELDRLLDHIALLAKCIEALTQEPQT